MSKELTTQETSKALAIPQEMAAWGADEVESTDIRLSRLLLMQAMSEAVGAGNAVPGDIIDSNLGTKVADKNSTFKIVPIYIFKNWVHQKMINGKFEFQGMSPFSKETANLPRESLDSTGTQLRNVIGINVLCMLEKDLNDPSALPVMLTFRMTSLNAGKDISTLAIRAQGVNKPVAAFTVELGNEFVKNDKGNYFVFKVKGVSETKNLEEVAPRLFKWYQTFKSGQAKVDAEVETTDTESTEIQKEVSDKF